MSGMRKDVDTARRITTTVGFVPSRVSVYPSGSVFRPRTRGRLNWPRWVCHGEVFCAPRPGILKLAQLVLTSIVLPDTGAKPHRSASATSAMPISRAARVLAARAVGSH